jgi:hypothetical protein
MENTFTPYINDIGKYAQAKVTTRHNLNVYNKVPDASFLELYCQTSCIAIIKYKEFPYTLLTLE